MGGVEGKGSGDRGREVGIGYPLSVPSLLVMWLSAKVSDIPTRRSTNMNDILTGA